MVLLEFVHWHYLSGHTMALGSSGPLKEYQGGEGGTTCHALGLLVLYQGYFCSANELTLVILKKLHLL